MFFTCEVFAALKTFFFTVFTDGILGRTLKYFFLLQKQNIFLQKCYSTQSTNMNKRIRQKCFSEILFSVSDQVKKKRKIKRILLFFSSVYFDPNILSRVFKTKSIKLKKTFFFTAAKNIFFLSWFCLVWHEKILENVSLKPFFCQTRWQQLKK